MLSAFKVFLVFVSFLAFSEGIWPLKGLIIFSFVLYIIYSFLEQNPRQRKATEAVDLLIYFLAFSRSIWDDCGKASGRFLHFSSPAERKMAAEVAD